MIASQQEINGGTVVLLPSLLFGTKLPLDRGVSAPYNKGDDGRQPFLLTGGEATERSDMPINTCETCNGFGEHCAFCGEIADNCKCNEEFDAVTCCECNGEGTRYDDCGEPQSHCECETVCDGCAGDGEIDNEVCGEKRGLKGKERFLEKRKN